MRKRTMNGVLVLCCALLVTAGAGVARAAEAAAGSAKPLNLAGAADGSAKVWLESSLRRVFPKTQPGSSELRLLAARNTRLSFQVAARNEHTKLLFVECAITGADDLEPRVREVGLVPVHHVTPLTEASDIDGAFEHVPGLVPDPLYPKNSLTAGPFESRSFWITLNVPADAKPGTRELTVRVTARSGTAKAKETVVEMPVRLQIGELVVQPRKNFPVTHWWQGQATWDYYKTGMFEDPKWWEITRAQLENMLEHGSDVVYVPVFFSRREKFNRPCQLLIVNEPSPGKYEFDWSQVKKFTDMSKEIGFKEFEWTHLWIYWGVKNPMPIYTKKGGEYVMLWPPDISGFSDTYLNFLKQYLPELKAFLDREGLLEHSYFHLSDEPHKSHIENYRKARQILRELAPWMKTMDALSAIEYGREGVTDMPIPQVDDAQKFIDEKIPHWVYYCTSPKGPWINRFMDTPLVKVRMSGWLFYRLGAKGFLHWGYNYWHKIETEQLIDPFTDGSAADYPGIPYGDPFVIYPGPDGNPIDSLRWEVFAESLQDYAMLQSAGIKQDDPLLAELKTYAEFPRDPEWFRGAMEQLISRKSVAAKTAP